jgi:DNA-binding XRE family transcriptional regulator
MKTITRTYKDGCKWCNATGSVQNPISGTVADIMIKCPVCDGTKTIIITDEVPILYKVEMSKPSEFVLTTEQMIEAREAMERDRANIASKILFGETSVPIGVYKPRYYKYDETDWRGLREKRGLGLREVAKFTGLSPATISRIERGKDSLVTNLNKLKAFYNGKNNKTKISS